jgi:hypothetical protein
MRTSRQWRDLPPPDRLPNLAKVFLSQTIHISNCGCPVTCVGHILPRPARCVVFLCRDDGSYRQRQDWMGCRYRLLGPYSHICMEVHGLAREAIGAGVLPDDRIEQGEVVRRANIGYNVVKTVGGLQHPLPFSECVGAAAGVHPIAAHLPHGRISSAPGTIADLHSNVALMSADLPREAPFQASRQVRARRRRLRTAS